MTASAPRDQPLKVSDELVQALVADQFPDLTDREVGRHHALEDHVSVRLGDDYGAIFPTTDGQDERFASITEILAPMIPTWTFPWSAPIRTGKPGHGFPYHWVIVPWITASTAGFVPLHADSAAPIGDALRQIHREPPAEAPDSPFTAGNLADRSQQWAHLIEQVRRARIPEERVLDLDVTKALWDNAVAAGPSPSRTWTHGNFEPRAILSDRGRFAGVLLWQWFGAGNPEADLGAATLLIPTDARDTLLDAYGTMTPDALARIQGFELLAAFTYIASGDPFIGRLAWERLIELGLVVAPQR